MNNDNSKETRSYKDPMAARAEAGKRRREALQAKFPPVKDSYDGFYAQVGKLAEEGNRYLLSAEGIIGTELAYDTKSACLQTKDGRLLSKLNDKDAKRLESFAQEGCTIKPILAAVFFRAQDKSSAAEVAFICWKPLDATFDAALATFAKNMAGRLASGDRAGLELSQDQFIDVLRSDGSWYLTKTKKRAPLEKGTVIYKNKRNSTEQLTGYAVNHKIGCTVLASLFWLVLAIGVVALIWFFFFS